MAVEVNQLREDEPFEAVLHELMKGADMAIPVDCADPNVQFVVRGWFVFPHGSLVKKHDVTVPA